MRNDSVEYSCGGQTSSCKAWQSRRRISRLARKIGVSVVMGSDAAETNLHGANSAELDALVAAGFSEMEAIRAATINAAKLAGMDDEIGAIEVGKPADLVGVRGDVLAKIRLLHQVVFVMKGVVMLSDAAPHAVRWRQCDPLPDFGVNPARAGFGPAAELPTSSPACGVTAVATGQSLLRNPSAATAAPLSLQHAAAQFSVRTLGPR